ncbi:MAG TPA: DUF4911 domain-containing protein [Deltaproteobacteria bacterium]|nr:DUF4911 domain-containing protein [Deltaproteobacteria bacterium]
MQSIRRSFVTERSKIGYIRFTIESYDGMALVSTVDPQKAIIELKISPGCEGMVLELLESLRRDEGLKIGEVL